MSKPRSHRPSLKRISGSPFFSAARWDAASRRWLLKSTGCTAERAARQVEARWLREGEDLIAKGAAAGAVGRTVAEHVADFIDEMRLSPRGVTARHVDDTRGKLDAVLAIAGWGSLEEITTGEWLRAIDAIRDAKRGAGEQRASGGQAGPRTGVGKRGPKRKAGSNSTRNRYRAAWVSFLRWCVRRRRIDANPIADLDTFPTEGRETFRRSPLSPAELRALRSAVADAGPRYGLTGPERSMLYLVATSTGFRVQELASLTVGSIRFGDPPVVVLQWKATKSKKGFEMPLWPPVAEELRRWTAGKPREARLWPALVSKNSAPMVYEDEELAGIGQWEETPSGGRRRVRPDGSVLDFHNMRHTFCTWAAQAGVTPQELQRLARHGNIKTTLKFYVHLSTQDLATAVGKVARSRSAMLGEAVESVADPAPTDAEEARDGDGVRRDACAIPPADCTADRYRTGRTGGGGLGEVCADGRPEAVSEAGVASEEVPTMTERDESNERPERDLNPRITDLQSGPAETATDSPSANGTTAYERPEKRTENDPRLGLRRSARVRAEAGEKPDLEGAIAKIHALGAMADLGSAVAAAGGVA